MTKFNIKFKRTKKQLDKNINEKSETIVKTTFV
jgi:hypothetical protein